MLMEFSLVTALLAQAMDLNALVDRLAPAYGVGVILLLLLQLTAKSAVKAPKKVVTATLPVAKSTPAPPKEASEETRPVPERMAGTWKMTGSENTSEFLAWGGAGWAARQAICAQRSTHVLTFNSEANAMRIQIDGILSQDYTYVIGGATQSTKLRTTEYEDEVFVEGESLVLKKNRVRDGVIIYNYRVLVDDSNMTLTSVGHGTNGDTIEQRQFFVRQG
uniref:Uncharacterized protein n=1 Tax=Pinguiococcus pyrenoidosus TaxID=172671 RepID=A0A7R9UA12_9STRA|mmetsp:Transcript_2171/g.9447  ORF Transcript_2171/g.9447 Transcript_2171/m.9447 type:complete len:220 (+) Transcript_2171:133-792(+)